MNPFIKYTIVGIILIEASLAFANRIPAPPKIDNITVAEQQYLQTLYNQHNILEVTSTNPNGSRRGNNGEVITFSSGGTVYIGVCTSTPSGYNWIAK
jgi:hypothetical protein